MHQLRKELGRLARVPWPVRLEGPSGAGKGVAARFLHGLSGPPGAPFVPAPMTHFGSDLALGQLVGYVKGAFTGAERDTRGVFERAHGGTLFLDEIADARADVQGALLQLLEDGAVTRLGEERARRVNIRIVFASNADLETRVRDGRFRLDLYHRLGILVVRLPALAEHLEDVPEIADHLLGRLAAEAAVPRPRLTARDIEVLSAYGWPGNVRELENVLKHLLTHGALPALVLAGDPAVPWRDRLDATLARHGGNRSAAARALGVSRKTLYEELAARDQEEASA